MDQLTKELAKTLLPPRDERQAKWAFGRALLCCGSTAMPGAAVMSIRAALRSGVGLCVLASVPEVLAAMPAAAPECILCAMPKGPSGSISERGLPALLKEAERCGALLCGCGLTVCNDTRVLVREILECYEGTLVLDADALNIVAEEPDMLERAAGRVLLTPHGHELARLLGGKTVCTAAEFAAKYRVTLLCKGGVSDVIVPGGPLYRLDSPNSGMAKGGSGDVLSGLIAGLAAQGLIPEKAAALGAFVHAEAGRLAREKLGPRAMLPSDVTACIGAVFLELE